MTIMEPSQRDSILNLDCPGDMNFLKNYNWGSPGSSARPGYFTVASTGFLGSLGESIRRRSTPCSEKIKQK